MFKTRCLWLLLVFLPYVIHAQIGGQRSYEFVNIPSQAVINGLGGQNVSLVDADVNLALANPALSGDTLSGLFSVNYGSYVTTIDILSAIYQHDFGKAGSWFMGVQHVGYGEFDSFDASGFDLGTLKAGETQLFVGRSHRIANYSLGGTLKFLSSNIAGFSSNAIALDLGGAFIHPKKQFTAGLVIKNLGFALSQYSQSDKAKLPFDLRLGMSFKPKHMPFRFSFTGYNLYRSDISYFDADNPLFTEDKPSTFDNIFRHVVIGTELLLSQNVNFRIGYNHLVKQELKLEESARGAGISLGLVIRVKAFEFAFSRGGYHAAGDLNTFGLTVNTNTLLRKGKL